MTSNSLHLADYNLKRIHVNQANLRKKVKGEAGGPCYTIKSGGKTYWAQEVSIYGPSNLVEQIQNPLSCGARLWIETTAEVNLINWEAP